MAVWNKRLPILRAYPVAAGSSTSSFGKLTGYGVKTVPGVREARGPPWEDVRPYTELTATVLNRYRAQLEQLTALLRK